MYPYNNQQWSLRLACFSIITVYSTAYKKIKVRRNLGLLVAANDSSVTTGRSELLVCMLPLLLPTLCWYSFGPVSSAKNAPAVHRRRRSQLIDCFSPIFSPCLYHLLLSFSSCFYNFQRLHMATTHKHKAPFTYGSIQEVDGQGLTVRVFGWNSDFVSLV